MTENIHNISDQELLSRIEFPEGWLDGVEDDLYAELEEAAWNILHENPGIVFADWRQMLIEQYPSEVVDVYGRDPEVAYGSLAEMFNSLTSDKLK